MTEIITILYLVLGLRIRISAKIQIRKNTYHKNKKYVYVYLAIALISKYSVHTQCTIAVFHVIKKSYMTSESEVEDALWAPLINRT